MVNWNVQTLVIPIVSTIFTSGLVISAFSNWYSNTYLRPNIKISIIPNEADPSLAKTELTNTGNVPAMHLLLTIQTSQKILGYRIFSTVNWTINNFTRYNNDKLLQIQVPEFISGQGSIIRIDTRIDGNKNTLPIDYVSYVIYDQGSTVTEATLAKSTILKKVSPADKVVNEWIDGWTQFKNYALTMDWWPIVIMLTAIPSIVLWSLYIKRRRSYPVAYMKKIMATRLITHQDKEKLKLFDDLQNELNDALIKGKINNSHYQLLSDRISIYLHKHQRTLDRYMNQKTIADKNNAEK